MSIEEIHCSENQVLDYGYGMPWLCTLTQLTGLISETPSQTQNGPLETARA